MQKLLSIIILFVLAVPVYSQHEQFSYIPPTDPLVIQKIDQWQDWKFGLLMHWGAYSIKGAVESWSICPEDADWIPRPHDKAYCDYKQEYEALPLQFNPTQFDPAKWAKAAKDGGMKYMVFTTKHHDGFCMFDTKATEYKITGKEVPFHTDPRADVTKYIFEAFRNEGMGIGAYFSKPDWHCPDYWDPYFPPIDRQINYDKQKHPEKWNRFKDYTHQQIRELLTNYGKVDILWLDGGWVRKLSEETPESKSWLQRPQIDQDIDMEGLSREGRQLQPGLIVVDRSVHNAYENYRTPEQEIPDTLLPYPWETCMTMATSWSYAPHDKYKSPQTILNNLIRIVAFGGNYLLNIGPGPDGKWHDEAYKVLEEVGAWLHTNGEAIYSTRPVYPYRNENTYFTKSKSGQVFALYVLPEAGPTPSTITWQGMVPTTAKIKLLGTDLSLDWQQKGDKIEVVLPASLGTASKLKYALVFAL